jgi:hypothetical protein
MAFMEAELQYFFFNDPSDFFRKKITFFLPPFVFNNNLTGKLNDVCTTEQGEKILLKRVCLEQNILKSTHYHLMRKTAVLENNENK